MAYPDRSLVREAAAARVDQGLNEASRRSVAVLSRLVGAVVAADVQHQEVGRPVQADSGPGERRVAARVPYRWRQPVPGDAAGAVRGRRERDFGWFTVPLHPDDDAAVDFVVPQHHDGPDGRYGTADDFTTLITLLNTTPDGPVRCVAANRAPMPARTLRDRALPPKGTLAVDVSEAFADPDGDAVTYSAFSSAPQVVATRAADAVVTLTARHEGTAAVTVTATDAGGLSAAQSFAVAVLAVGFTDDPIEPSVTPVRAVHLTVLRTRIDILRASRGLPAFSWTDPVLTPG